MRAAAPMIVARRESIEAGQLLWEGVDASARGWLLDGRPGECGVRTPKSPAFLKNGFLCQIDPASVLYNMILALYK